MVKINGTEIDGRKVPQVIRKQPGYSGEGSYQVAEAKTGGYRLYKWVSGKWMDASLSDIPSLETILATSEAARAMGSVKSPAKTAAVRENGKKGGRPKVRGDGDCYALMMTNGRWSAIISNRAVAESFGECLLTASSRARLISKIEASEYAGYYQDGLIEGLNDGKRCERWSVRPV